MDEKLEKKIADLMKRVEQERIDRDRRGEPQIRVHRVLPDPFSELMTTQEQADIFLKLYGLIEAEQQARKEKIQ
jgi:hypothetical protein